MIFYVVLHTRHWTRKNTNKTTLKDGNLELVISPDWAWKQWKKQYLCLWKMVHWKSVACSDLKELFKMLPGIKFLLEARLWETKSFCNWVLWWKFWLQRFWGWLLLTALKNSQKENEKFRAWLEMRELFWWWIFCENLITFRHILHIWNSTNPYSHFQNYNISWIHKFMRSLMWELGHWLEKSGTLRIGTKAFGWNSVNPTTVNSEILNLLSQ